MDEGPPPFNVVAETQDEPRFIHVVEEDSDDSDRDMSLPDPDFDSISHPPSVAEVPRNFVEEPTSVPEYTTEWSDGSVTQLKSVVHEEQQQMVIKVAKQLPNGHIDTMSGISETVREYEQHDASTFKPNDENLSLASKSASLEAVVEQEQGELNGSLTPDEPAKSDSTLPAAAPEEDDDEFGDFTVASTSSLDDQQTLRAQEDSTQGSGDANWGFSAKEDGLNSTQGSETPAQGWDAFAAAPSGSGDADDDDDEWGDFAAAATVVESKPATRASINDADDWDEADFVAAPPPPKIPEISLPLIGDKLAISTDFDGLLVDEEYPDDRPEDAHVFAIRETLDAGEEPSMLVSEIVSRCSEIWLALRIVEEAVSLRYQFPDSALEALFHEALGVDKHAIRTTTTTQALSDAVLVPTPIGENSGRGGRPVTLSTSGSGTSITTKQNGAGGSITPANHDQLQPQRTWFSRRSLRFWSSSRRAESGSGAGGSQPAAAARSKSSSPPPFKMADSLAVPPADFNWADAGLVNPLKSGGSSPGSTLLDVDFFDPKGPQTVTSSAAFLERDLEQLGLSTTTSSKQLPGSMQNSADLVSSLLQQSASGGHQQRQTVHLKPSELSLDALALHDRLPSLSFLLDKCRSFHK